MDMVSPYSDIWGWLIFHVLFFHASHMPETCIQMTADASSPSFCMLPYFFHVNAASSPSLCMLPYFFHVNAASLPSFCMLPYLFQVNADASSLSCCMLPYLFHACMCQKAAGDALTTSTLGCYAQACATSYALAFGSTYMGCILCTSWSCLWA